MGSIISQCIKEGIHEISITYSGTVAELETSYLTKAALAGFFKNRIAVNVNEVNAFLTAKERGITVGEKISADAYGYANSQMATTAAMNAMCMIFRLQKILSFKPPSS